MGSEQHQRRGWPGAITTLFGDPLWPVVTRACLVLPLSLLVSVDTPALGQGAASVGRTGMPLARHAPASANLFIAIRRLDEVDAAMRRAHAWRLLPMLAGSPVDAGSTFDPRAALTSFLGPASAIRVDDLMQTEMGILAPSWRQLSGAVWLVRLADRSVVDRWFPVSRRQGGRDSHAPRFFKTGDDVLVCTRDDVAAIARRKGSGSLLHETMLLMAGRRGPVLEEAPEYQELIAYLPHRPLAVAYVRTGADQAASQSAPSPVWPAVDRAVVGLYEGDGRIDLAIRASLRSPESRQPLSAETIDRLVHLPQTTLFATAITMDFDRAYEAATQNRSPVVWRRLLTLLSSVYHPAGADREPLPQLGPHVIVAWDQDLRVAGSSPQVAIMIQCTDARRLCGKAVEIARHAISVIQKVDTAGAEALPTIREAEHLGTPIRYVPLEEYAQRSRFRSMALVRATEPAWAALGDEWLVLALSRDHIERILDARHGLIPTLSTVRDVRSLQQKRAKRTALSIVQADLAADVLDRWLEQLEAGSPSLLDPRWWADPNRLTARERLALGIGMNTHQQPGVVVVARVYPRTAADGRLEPLDRIMGIDGRLLDLESPNADLRKGWIASQADPGPTLRVQRGDTLMDVTLPRRREAIARPHTLLTEPADAVRELASLARALEFASFASYVSEETRYSARISLRLAPTSSP